MEKISAQQDDVPEIIKNVGFDFSWDERKVWILEEPVMEMNIAELLWHFDIPFLSEGGGVYNLTPREVMEYPDRHAEEYNRTLSAVISHPIDIMENKGKLLILDGLHRLMKLSLQGETTIKVRIIPREKISKIIK